MTNTNGSAGKFTKVSDRMGSIGYTWIGPGNEVRVLVRWRSDATRLYVMDMRGCRTAIDGARWWTDAGMQLRPAADENDPVLGAVERATAVARVAQYRQRQLSDMLAHTKQKCSMAGDAMERWCVMGKELAEDNSDGQHDTRLADVLVELDAASRRYDKAYQDWTLTAELFYEAQQALVQSHENLRAAHAAAHGNAVPPAPRS